LVRERTESLSRKTAFLEAVINSSHDGIVATDGKGKSLLMNRQYLQMRHIPREMADRDDPTPLFEYALKAVKDPEAFRVRMAHFMNHPQESGEDEIEMKDESVFHRFTSPVRGSDGRLYGRIFAYREITGRKRAEATLRENEGRLQAIMDASPIGISWADLQGNIEYCNPKFRELFGYSVEDIPTIAEWRRLADPDPPYSSSITAADIATHGGNENPGKHLDPTEMTITCKDGTRRFVTQAIAFTSNRILCILTDLTERRRTEEALTWKTAFLEAQVNSSLDGILVIDSKGRNILQNQRTLEMWKVPKYLVDKKRDSRQQRHMIGMARHPAQFRKKMIYLHRHPGETGRDEVELKDGTVLDSYSCPVLGKDGEYFGRIWTFRDITELKHYWTMLENLSTTDGLTDLPNRRRFDEFLKREWRRAMRDNTLLSLIMMDIDCFKEFNDHYGHLAGDDCLRRVAGVLAEIVKRPGDLAARYGGEEFACILPDTDLNGALVLANAVRSKINDISIPHFFSAAADHVTLSFGVATMIPEKGQSASDLIRMADDLLYGAKQSGRNQVRSWMQLLIGKRVNEG
jgi:diguanylate cyclase (GGDEF)-like protein/PAS domain S-box-containing protein